MSISYSNHLLYPYSDTVPPEVLICLDVVLYSQLEVDSSFSRVAKLVYTYL
jgi:hypothetical protein